MIIEISFFEINKKRLQKAFDDKYDSDEEEEYNNQVRNLQPETNVSRLCSVIQIFGFEIGELICNLCIMTAQIGFCISYLIFIGRNCNLYICPDGSCDYYNHSIVISLLVLIPLSFLKNLKDLTIVTQIGTVSIFSGLIIILISALFLSEDSYSYHSDTNPDEGFVYMNPMRLPYFLGIAAFQFEGVSVLLPIQKTMINKPKFKSIFSKTIWKLFVFTSIFAIVCYSSYGKNIDQIVMFNLPHSLLSTFTRMFYMIGIMLTYNIQLYPVLFSIYSADWYSKMEDNYVKYFIFVSINSSIICLTAYIAMYIPSFATFINLIGALSCGILIYILPPLAYILTMSQLNLGDKISQLYLSTIPILVFGFIICITGTYASSLEIIEKFKKNGYSIIDDFLSKKDIETLRYEAVSLYKKNKFKISQSTRFDNHLNRHISYEKSNVFATQLEGGDDYFESPRLHEYVYATAKSLTPLFNNAFKFRLDGRLAANKLAVCTGNGSHYDKHYDNAGSGDLRKLTCILWLNAHWREELGGEFRAYAGGRVVDIPPRGGRLLLFEADRLIHSVQPSTAYTDADHRYALTVWLPTLDPDLIKYDEEQDKIHFDYE
eukprot:Mrub_01527.p1 GENE.Mrub_01527~~Mrub_01527.p1  ORF type:complete len:688 (-),score=65.14 Mrub_01527:57-1862(-)